ncbi:hypothetical protein TIFTF001_017004 [Ficus carica]|uniref:Uncharacterized protein n=1 Tax=Ficus carica TaxID=3494 RepID=A0AA88DIY4_FICCA|nr:hypothetical protein TIFTF001_017004 [Ficus carica]
MCIGDLRCLGTCARVGGHRGEALGPVDVQWLRWVKLQRQGRDARGKDGTADGEIDADRFLIGVRLFFQRAESCGGVLRRGKVAHGSRRWLLGSRLGRSTICLAADLKSRSGGGSNDVEGWHDDVG